MIKYANNKPDLTPEIWTDPKTGKKIYMYSFQAYEYWCNINRDKSYRNKGSQESPFIGVPGTNGHRVARHGIGE